METPLTSENINDTFQTCEEYNHLSLLHFACRSYSRLISALLVNPKFVSSFLIFDNLNINYQ